MPEILPFSALRYNPEAISLSDVVTQPYDKISPAMQKSYYACSPYNVVRIILGKTEAGDDANHNVYTRAAASFQTWRTQGVLRPESAQCVYPYSQEFAAPGETRKRKRQGFIALGRLYEYGEGIVFRHEQTLAVPKSDRLQLLRATRAHFGQIFMLYSDPQRAIEVLLDAAGGAAAGEVEDEYGVCHRVRTVSNPEAITAVRRLMSEKQLIIADGHHRYETALEYRRERRAMKPDTAPAPYDYVMMTFFPMEDAGLVILPTHRVVQQPGFDETQLRKSAARWFAIEVLHVATQFDEARERLHRTTGTAFLLVTRTELLLLSALPDTINRELAQLSPRQRGLDVVVLHKLILEKGLGMSEESIRNQEHITYLREAAEAVAMVQRGSADCAFLMNGVRVEQMCQVALAGEVLPQKSTDFYPKLLSGLAIYALD